MCLHDLRLTALIRAPSTVGKCPGSKTDHAKVHANLAFWAVFTELSLLVLCLTPLQSSQQGHPQLLLPALESWCSSVDHCHALISRLKCQWSRKAAFPALCVYFVSLSIGARCYDFQQFHSGQILDVQNHEGKEATSLPPRCHTAIQTEVSATLQALLLSHSQKQPHKRSHTSAHALLLLCTLSFSDAIFCASEKLSIFLGWEKGNQLPARALNYNSLLATDSKSQNIKSHGGSLPSPMNHTENTSKKYMWKEDLFLHFIHPLALKWLNGNTGKPRASATQAAPLEFILAFDVTAIITQSFWSTVISFKNQNDPYSESFPSLSFIFLFFPTGRMSYLGFVPHG